mmetsp:Transcript_85556/g.151468  ORF Transcript_85556/g.151468 Transcript_85556/m.151468 type:complete len:83 (+) Transcript_85556:100-348(+)
MFEFTESTAFKRNELLSGIHRPSRVQNQYRLTIGSAMPISNVCYRKIAVIQFCQPEVPGCQKTVILKPLVSCTLPFKDWVLL